MTSIVVVLMLWGLLGMIRSHRESVRRDKAEILDRFSEGDRLAYQGKVIEASDAYIRVLAGLGNWVRDADVSLAADAARDKLASMATDVRAAVKAREGAAIAAAESERALRAAREARAAAESAAAADRASRGDVGGVVSLDRRDGGVARLPELVVRLLPARAPYSDLDETGALMAVGEKIEGRGLPSDSALADVRVAYRLLRDTDTGQSPAELIERFHDEPIWPRIVERIAVGRSVTGPNGIFSFRDVPAGDYLVHAALEVDGARVEWLLPTRAGGSPADLSLDGGNTSLRVSAAPPIEKRDRRDKRAERR